MAQIIVTSTADDDGVGTTLREAIAEAEANGLGADEIVFDALLAGQTIHLTSGVLSIASGSVSINGDTNGDGNPDIIISGDALNDGRTSDDSSIFTIANGATASLTSLQLSGGYGRGDNGVSNARDGLLAVGAIYNAGTLSITDSIISDNYARGGDGYSATNNGFNYVNGGNGGDAAAGILNVGTLTVTETAFENNKSYAGKGGTGAAENDLSGNYDGGNGGNAGSIINSGTADFSHVGFLSYSHAEAGNGGTGGAQNTGYTGGDGGNGGSAAVGIVNTGTSTGEAGYLAGNVFASFGFYGLGGTGTPNGNDGVDGSGALTLNYLGGTVTGFTNLGSAPFDGVTSGADTITGTGFGDLIISLTGNDFVNADSGADTVYGGAGTDQLFGGIDNDTLFGGSGDDFINGQTEDDTVEGGLGNDTMEGGSNTAAGDTLSFANFIAVSGSLGITVNLDNAAQQNTGAGLDTITGFENVTGSAFDDTITGSYGGAVNNILNGMGGNDTIVMYDGYFSADHFNGGANVDTLLADKNWSSGVIFNMSLGTTTLFANSFNTFEQIENITVGGYAQVIGDGFDNVITVTQTGSAKTNTLSGGGGDDTIEGAQGADILNGDGNGLFGDTVSYSQSAAGVTVNLTVAIQGGGGDAAGDTLSGFENVTGSANNDTIAGNAGANVLKGEAGTGDTLNYTDSNGLVNVNLQTRIVSGGHAAGDTISGFENLTGSAFGDTLTGSNLANLLAGGNGNDRLFGGIGSDVLNGGDNNDTLEGGIDGDQLNGGLNTDTASYSRSTAGVTVNLLTGAATLGDAAGDSFNSIENLRGSNHGDRLTLSNVAGRADGLNGDDVMSGGTAADRLFGGNNNDVIAGRKGADLLSGGSGFDRFVFSFGDSGQTIASADRITDYQKGAVGTGDEIDFGVAMSIGGSNAAATVTQAQINAATGVASFAVGSGNNIADAMNDITARMAAAGTAAGEFALFRIAGAGDFYLFVSDAASGVTANDVLIKLDGETSIGSINLTGGDLTLL